jgi:TonB-linked SusC/RagA family outer membrane protein
MTFQCPADPKVTSKGYWLGILIVVALVSSMNCQAQDAASMINIPHERLTYDSVLRLIGRQLHVLSGHEAKCPEFDKICPLHGKMTFGKFFEPLKAQGFIYEFAPDNDKQSIMLIIKRASAKSLSSKIFTAYTTDENGDPLAGVSVEDRATGEKKATDSSGRVSFGYDAFPVELTLTHVGRTPVRQTILRDGMKIPLAIDQQNLEAALVSFRSTKKGITTLGYSTVINDGRPRPYEHSNHGLSGIATGTVQTMIEGRMSGVLTTQTSGIPGSSSYLSVRGQSSAVNGIDPTYVIDGITAAAGNLSTSNIQSANAGGSMSPWSYISPNDIERVDVLKDADATAIYGSRGANGVVLITTKHWTAGIPTLALQVSAGASKVTGQLPFMNTSEYLAMRREALQNSGLTVNYMNAPDFKLLDTARYFDWGKWLLGRPARSIDTRLAISGGTAQNNYTVGMDYLKETTPFPTQPAHDRIATHFNYNHRSASRRWTLQLSGLAGWDANHQVIGLDPTAYRTLIPDAPPTLDQNGQLIFPAGIASVNPLGQLRQPYEALSGNYLLSVVTNYALSDHFFLRTTAGFHHLQTHEFGEMPLADQNPACAPQATGFFSTTSFDNRSFEPQFEYRRQDGKLSISWIGGASLQGWDEHATARADTGYTNDISLLQHDHAIPTNTSAVAAHDVYSGLFSNLNANWNDRYILSLTARRDGSSRFPADHRFATLGSAALAWIFVDPTRFSRLLPFVSYGKIKVSEGVTGNNQIGDRTLQNFAGTSIQSFQSISGLYPSSAPAVGWERTYKSELSLDLGFLENRLLFNATAYRHYSDNLLQNGEFTMTRIGSQPDAGLPAVIENYGYELSLSAKLVDKNYFGWDMGINWTVPLNKLVSFPELNKSIYANRLVIGQSINVLRGYVYKGVDSQSGLYRFADLNGDGRITKADQTVVGKFDVTGFGGFENNFRWRQFQLGLLIDVRLATGVNYLAPIFANGAPGSISAGLSSNEPRLLLDHWRYQGNRAAYQKIYAAPDVDADSTLQLWLNSSALLTNTSFVRLRTLSFAYELPAARAAAMHLSSLSLFIDAQNLLVLSPCKTDPEIQSVLILPTMRTIEVGVRLMR